MGKNDRFVTRRGDKWAVVAPHAKRASAIKPTQATAEKRAKEIVSKAGGGEVRIQAATIASAIPIPSPPVTTR